ncbi:MAG: protein kinase [Chlamydiales bacterium]|nr:protein kinase [Chlamydiales bacterium]
MDTFNRVVPTINVIAPAVELRTSERAQRTAWEEPASEKRSVLGVDAFALDKLKIAPTCSDYILRTISFCMYTLPEPVSAIRRSVTRVIPHIREEQISLVVRWLLAPLQEQTYVWDKKNKRPGFYTIQCLPQFGIIINTEKIPSEGSSKKLIHSYIVPIQRDVSTNVMLVGKVFSALEYRIRKNCRPSLIREWTNMKRTRGVPHLFTSSYVCWQREENPNKVSLLVEKQETSLSQFLAKRQPKIGQKKIIIQTLRYLYQIGQAIESLHERGYIHRDIKLGNILLKGGVASLADLHELITITEWRAEQVACFRRAEEACIVYWDGRHTAAPRENPLSGQERLEVIKENSSFKTITKSFCEYYDETIEYPSLEYVLYNEMSNILFYMIEINIQEDISYLLGTIQSQMQAKIRGTPAYTSGIGLHHQFQSKRTDVYAFLQTISFAIQHLRQEYSFGKGGQNGVFVNQYEKWIGLLEYYHSISSRYASVDMERILHWIQGLLRDIEGG